MQPSDTSGFRNCRWQALRASIAATSFDPRFSTLPRPNPILRRPLTLRGASVLSSAICISTYFSLTILKNVGAWAAAQPDTWQLTSNELREYGSNSTGWRQRPHVRSIPARKTPQRRAAGLAGCAGAPTGSGHTFPSDTPRARLGLAKPVAGELRLFRQVICILLLSDVSAQLLFDHKRGQDELVFRHIYR